MDTPLDTTAAWLWFPASAEYKDGELRLVLAEGVVSKERVQLEILPGTMLKDLYPLGVPPSARKILVHFSEVKLLYVLGEAAYREFPGGGAGKRCRCEASKLCSAEIHCGLNATRGTYSRGTLPLLSRNGTRLLPCGNPRASLRGRN